ncbi:integrase [Pandoraea sputorum]|uniref:Integrase n=1 Tax=Pandoraea sputorum TaxID=93222 RepID=A0A5E5BKR5_9BURK|nr:integrase [Pandoraea sputorum]
MRRTLERRIRQWRALEGPTQEVFFPQEHQPGVRGLSDFTDMSKLCVTIGGAPFGHRLYHFVLAFSRWEYANVVEGGREFRGSRSGIAERAMAGGRLSP